jgi:hypothetical protein
VWKFTLNYVSLAMMAGATAFNVYGAISSHRAFKKMQAADNELRQECTRFRMMCNVINRLATKSQIQEINRELEAVNLLIDSKIEKIPKLKLVEKDNQRMHS